MDQAIATMRADVSANDSQRQLHALLQALQFAASGNDMSGLAKTVCDEIIASSASATSKKLAFDIIRGTRLTGTQWETVCRGLGHDFECPDPDVIAVGVSFIPALPSWRIGKFIKEHAKEISNCIVFDNANLRHSAVEALGCLLARDDIITLCANDVNLLDRVQLWWRQIGLAMLDLSDMVSSAAFEAVGRLFAEFSSKRLSRLSGDKLIPSDSSLAIRSSFVAALCEHVWSKRDLLMARSAVFPLDSVRVTVYPLVFASRAVATGMVEEMQALSGTRPSAQGPNISPRRAAAARSKDFVEAERILGISDIVSHLVPFLSCLDPAIVYEVGTNLLLLAGVPGGKPEWAATPITAFLALWDRQEFAAGRESIVRAVVSNLHLLDLHMQVSLFKRLLAMVRNLRVEADRMHAIACICRTALSVDLFTRESVRRGQKPLSGSEISSLLEDGRTREELHSIQSPSLFREELTACLVESCFQLALPLPGTKTLGPGSSRVLGALAGGMGNEAMGWTLSALEVVEVCRPCVKWDCGGRTYAMDAYLRLLVRLCHLYDTAGGIKSIKDGASPEQVLVEQRLQTLHRQLLKDIQEVATHRMRVRVLWVLAEHVDVEGMGAGLLADDDDGPIAILVNTIHKLLFNVTIANRLQDVQAILVSAQHLGVRSRRARDMLTRELQEFKNGNLSDSVNKHFCRLILQIFTQVNDHPDTSWAGRIGSSGEYPFGHYKLSVQFNEPQAAQDRKLQGLVRTAVQELWRPAASELHQAIASGGGSMNTLPPARTLSGSSDPCYVEAYHLSDVTERRLTLHMKVLNMTEFELTRVDARVGLTGALNFMDASPQAVRQLRDLLSQDPVACDVTVAVTRFERCALCVQMVYYPGGNRFGTDDSGGGEDEVFGSQRRPSSTQRGTGDPDAVALRCKPYRVPLTELLLPSPCSPVEFFRMISSLPAAAEHTGKYTYFPSDRSNLTSDDASFPHFLSGLHAISQKPLYRVCSHILRSSSGFQLCYLSRTWFGDILAMIIFGTTDNGGDVLPGEDAVTMVCKFVLRSSAAHVLEEINADTQDWLDDLTGGAVRAVSEEEVREDTAEKLTRAAQLATVPRLSIMSNLDPLTGGSGPPTPNIAAAEEQEALHTAVLQEWKVLKAQQAVH